MNVTDEKFIKELEETIVSILVKEKKLRLLSHLAKNLAEQAEQHSKTLKVKAVTAFPLPAKFRKRIEQIIKKKGFDSVMIEEKIDPSLIGGIRLIVGDKHLDGSLKGILNQIN